MPISLRSASQLLVLAAVVASPAAGWSQSFIPKLSPGPLAEVHKQYDDTGSGCVKCHKLSGGISGDTCLECHEKQRAKIASGAGLHAGFVAQGRKCTECHTDHKGRTAAIADWRKVGSSEKFDHKLTGFVLTGMHETVKCTACHRGRTKTGSIVFLGLSHSCDGCHNNPHGFRQQKLRESCQLCHLVAVSAKNMTAAQVPFDHGEVTGINLVGRHAQIHCHDCHKNKKMTIGESPRTCANCHQSKHGASFPAQCTLCHDPSRKYQEVHFNHASTGYHLEGGHQTAPCRKCHDFKTHQKPPKACASCHKDPHGDRFKGRDCSQCHQPPGGLKTVEFEHDTLTRFALSGIHDEIKCRACHRGSGPKNFEKFPGPDCADCHRHKDVHKGQFKDKPCTSCHQGKKGGFDHNTGSRFKLTGAHLEVSKRRTKGCTSCHPGGIFRTNKVQCLDCHKDSHQGSLGTKCEGCHTPEAKFALAKVGFAHDEKTPFKLEGLHAKVACEKCHPRRNYRLGQPRCGDCHASTEPHKGKLGKDCEKCHRPEKGAPLFAHDSMTRFARTGRHAAVECGFCHRPAPADGPPEPGWTKTAKPVVDRTFPVMGKVCSECHKDKHQGDRGTSCNNCHNTVAFKQVSATVHDNGPFRLEGVHQTLSCKACHSAGRLLAGTGEWCQQCHRELDPHRNALGPFCGDCHVQTRWRPAQFSHLQTGFPLRGVHRTAPCLACHGSGTYQGLPTDCENCHATAAAKVRDPLHTAELRPCDRCHSEVGFQPVRNFHDLFPLRGRHRFIGCASCHYSGIYAGTPNTCETCHLTAYLDPRTQGAHKGTASTACGDCHTPVDWRVTAK